MIDQTNLQNLRENLSVKSDKKSLKHTINRHAKFFPFMTRGTERPKFKGGFEGVLGEFTRNISGKKLNNKLDNEKLISEMTKNVNAIDADKAQLEQILRMFLIDKNGGLKVFHPYMFQYLPFTEGAEARGEKEISKFLADVLIEGASEYLSYFKSSKSDDLISKLVLTNLTGLEENKEEIKYSTKLDYITKLFKKDLEFLYKHEDYFKSHYSLFMSYYYFFYITQLTLKIAQKTKADFLKNNEIFYTLDWEATSKNRKGYLQGYQTIKESSRNLLIDVNVLEHLNILFGTNTKTYSELKNVYEELSVNYQNQLKELLKEWIIEYRSLLELPEKISLESLDYEELVHKLFDSIQETYSKSTMLGPQSRYPLSIEEIGKKYFMKTRGSLGYMLNVSQDLLLLLTSLCLQDEKKSLKQVFFELELRGMFLDRYSQEEVVNLFDKLNLLDKKSDSGDAQYVKPIL